MPKKETQLDRIEKMQKSLAAKLDKQHSITIESLKYLTGRIENATNPSLPAAAPQPAEPWRPEVGDVVICEKRHTNGPSPQWNEAMDQFVGVPMIVRNNVRTYCVSTDKGWLWHHDWLRPCSPAELAAYHQEQEERLRREREEAERARPVGFGVAVKIKHSGNEGLVHYQLRDQPGRYSIIFNGGEQSNYNRDQFTVIHDQP